MNQILKVSYFQVTPLLCTKEANFLVEGTEKAILDLTLRTKIFGLENIEEKHAALYRPHTAILNRPLSSAATMEVQGPDTT